MKRKRRRFFCAKNENTPAEKRGIVVLLRDNKNRAILSRFSKSELFLRSG
jgi:hypothetical protein